MFPSPLRRAIAAAMRTEEMQARFSIEFHGASKDLMGRAKARAKVSTMSMEEAFHVELAIERQKKGGVSGVEPSSQEADL